MKTITKIFIHCELLLILPVVNAFCGNDCIVVGDQFISTRHILHVTGTAYREGGEKTLDELVTQAGALLWPDNTINYEWHSSMNQEDRENVKKAMAKISATISCIRWRETSSGHRLNIRKTNGNNCGAHVGYQSIDTQYMQVTRSCLMRQSTLVHVLLHVLGLGHPLKEGLPQTYKPNDLTLMSYAYCESSPDVQPIVQTTTRLPDLNQGNIDGLSWTTSPSWTYKSVDDNVPADIAAKYPNHFPGEDPSYYQRPCGEYQSRSQLFMYVPIVEGCIDPVGQNEHLFYQQGIWLPLGYTRGKFIRNLAFTGANLAFLAWRG